MLAFLDQYIVAGAPNRSKLTVHMRAAKLTADAAQRLFKVAEEQQVTLPEELKTSLSANPSLKSALESIEAFIKTSEASTEAAAALKKPIQELITPPNREGVQYIDKTWRSTLQVGPAAEPVEAFHVVE
jgi:hypothetical protein